MRVWDRLKGWVEEETSSVQMYMRLSEAASLYQLGKTGLWRPPDLQLALNWKKTQQPSLAWARKYNPAFEKVMVFLDASEKKFLQEEQNKVKLQRRTLSRTRRFATFMGVTAIAFLALMGYAYIQKTEADKLRKEAEIYASRMEQQKDVAVEESNMKEIERLKAMVGQDSAERSRMAALLQLHQAEQEKQQAVNIASEATKQSEVLQKTTEQAQLENQLAQLKAQKALEEQNKALQASSTEMKKRMLTTAQAMAVKVNQVDDKDLKGLLARQAFLFNQQYGGEENNPDVYNGLYSAMIAFKGVDYNSLKGHDGAVRSLVFMPNRNIFYSSGTDGKIIRWNMESGTPRPQTLIDNNFINRSLAISSNGRWLACGTGTSSIQLFNLNQPGVSPKLLEGHKGWVWDLQFIEGKDILISTSSDKSIIYWNLLTDEHHTIVTYNNKIRVICLSKDGTYVYGGTDDGKVIRWSVDKGEAKVMFDLGNSSVYAITMNSSGTRMAVGDKNGNVWILDPVTGKRITMIKAHSARVLDIQFSPDNTQLATSSFDGTIKIWNTRNLNETPVVITAHESWVFAIAFSNDGKTLVSSSEKGNLIYYWPTHAIDMADDMCKFVSRNMTKQEWNIYVGFDIDYQKTCSEKN